MNNQFIPLFAVFVIVARLVAAEEPQNHESQKAQIKSIVNRSTAVTCKLSLKLVLWTIQFLFLFLSHLILDRSTHPDRSDLACEVLSSIPNHGEYLRQYVIDYPNDIALKVRVLMFYSD